jgi:DNA-binding CsgD family transcriptional regulator
VLASRTFARSDEPSGGDVHAQRIASLIPDARLVIYDGGFAAAFAATEGPPAFVIEVEKFLNARDLELDVRPIAGDGAHAAADLSPRQREVLGLLAQGKTNREIAEALVLSERTVQRHVADTYAKIGARNRAEATAFALHHPGPDATSANGRGLTRPA